MTITQLWVWSLKVDVVPHTAPSSTLLSQKILQSICMRSLCVDDADNLVREGKTEGTTFLMNVRTNTASAYTTPTLSHCGSWHQSPTWNTFWRLHSNNWLKCTKMIMMKEKNSWFRPKHIYTKSNYTYCTHIRQNNHIWRSITSLGEKMLGKEDGTSSIEYLFREL